VEVCARTLHTQAAASPEINADGMSTDEDNVDVGTMLKKAQSCIQFEKSAVVDECNAGIQKIMDALEVNDFHHIVVNESF